VSIRPISTTMGQSSPASVASGTGYYRYRGNQPDKKTPPSEPLPQNRNATAAKRKRVAEYTRRRLEGESKEQAAAALGIKASTASYYERAFKEAGP
jgi:hypothetical protein